MKHSFLNSIPFISILLTIITGIALTTNAFAQSFLQENKIWYIYELMENETQPKTRYIKFEGDTLLDTGSYKKAIYSHSLENWLPWGILLRENSNVVFYQVESFSKEYILYDFNLKKGDYYYCPSDQEYFNNPFVVDSVVVRNVFGADRKHWYFSGAEWEEDFHKVAEVWIEGIGSLTNPLRSIGWGLVGGIEKLICVHEGENQLYQSPDFTGCDANTLDAPVIKNRQDLINIYSTENGVIKLKLKNEFKGEICLFGIDGRKVTLQKINREETQISVPTKGLVFYRFTNNIGEIQTGKVMVQ